MPQTCQNCTYHLSGDPPACNALHTPIAGDINCRDWGAREKINRGVFCSQPLGYNLQSSVKARRAAIARDTQRQADEEIAPIAFTFRVDRDRDSYQSSPAIALSELRTAIRGIRNPTRSGERWHVALPDEPMLSYSIGLKPLPTSPSFRQITLTAIATSSGLKWQYQGAVIID